MRKDKNTILIELNKSINKVLEQIETLESLTINKTKNGEYFKTITKKGFEIKNKNWIELYCDTYDNKYCLKYGYNYNAIYFADYKELETKKEKELERLNNVLKEYEKQKEYTINHFTELENKIKTFFKDLNEDEIKLLKNMKHSLYIEFMFF